MPPSVGRSGVPRSSSEGDKVTSERAGRLDPGAARQMHAAFSCCCEEQREKSLGSWLQCGPEKRLECTLFSRTWCHVCSRTDRRTCWCSRSPASGHSGRATRTTGGAEGESPTPRCIFYRGGRSAGTHAPSFSRRRVSLLSSAGESGCPTSHVT